MKAVACVPVMLCCRVHSLTRVTAPQSRAHPHHRSTDAEIGTKKSFSKFLSKSAMASAALLCVDGEPRGAAVPWNPRTSGHCGWPWTVECSRPGLLWLWLRKGAVWVGLGVRLEATSPSHPWTGNAGSPRGCRISRSWTLYLGDRSLTSVLLRKTAFSKVLV